MANAKISYRDYDGERASFGYKTVPVAGDGSNWTTINTQLASLRVLTSAIIRAQEVGYGINDEHRLPDGNSTNPESNREEKWLVSYTDTQQWLDAPTNTIANPGYGKKFNVEIPCADLSLRVGNSELVYNNGSVGVTDIDSWVTQFETVARSPYGGTVSVTTIASVGRNS